MADQDAAFDIIALRPFVPAKDYENSLRFYIALGFTARPLGDSLASMHLGPFSFLLQKFYVEGCADNFMMHLLVKNIEAWWQRIDSHNLAATYGVRAPTAPARQPWGLVVSYVVDPTGVLWHFAQDPQTVSSDSFR